MWKGLKDTFLEEYQALKTWPKLTFPFSSWFLYKPQYCIGRRGPGTRGRGTPTAGAEGGGSGALLHKIFT